jgi:hypothetical protein
MSEISRKIKRMRVFETYPPKLSGSMEKEDTKTLFKSRNSRYLEFFISFFFLKRAFNVPRRRPFSRIEKPNQSLSETIITNHLRAATDPKCKNSYSVLAGKHQSPVFDPGPAQNAICALTELPIPLHLHNLSTRLAVGNAGVQVMAFEGILLTDRQCNAAGPHQQTSAYFYSRASLFSFNLLPPSPA